MNARPRARSASPIELVLSKLGDYQAEGDGLVAHCPAHDDSNPSLVVSEGKDGRALLHCRTGCKTQRILDAIGLNDSDLFAVRSTEGPGSKPRKSVKPRRTPAAMVPALSDPERQEAKREASRLFKKSSFTGYKLAALYPYRRADGSIWCWRWRFEHPKHGKEIGPFHNNGTGWIVGEPTAPRVGKPLYRLPEVLAADGPVFVVEGEKCADALAALGIPATTSGSSSSAKGADWSGLSGRQCVIWPDNDDPGDQYAAAVAERLMAIGCSVSVIDTQALGIDGKGDDAADWLRANPKAVAADVLSLPTIEAPGAASTVRLTRASDLQPLPISWVWPGWLARKMLQIVAGEGGTGKTTLALTIAAAVSTGGKLPDGAKAPVGNVVIWTGEDALQEVILPRLLLAGATLSRIHFVQGGEDGPFDPSQDMPALQALAAKVGNVALVIIDPIVNAVAGDSHKNAEVRRGLGPLVALAESLNAAVLGITHFAKNTTGRKTTDRIIGSVAYSNLSRVSMATAKGRDGACRLVRCKSNIGPDGCGFSYAVEVVTQQYGDQSNDVSRISWGAQLSGSATDLLDELEQKKLARDDAAEWLAMTLSNGPMPQKEVQAKAKEDGFAYRTIERAKDALRVLSYPDREKGAGKGNGKWMWSLPPATPTKHRPH